MYRHGPSVLARPRLGRRLLSLARQEEGKPQKQEAVTSEVRQDLVARVRAEIAAGTYDTEEKWEAALDRLGRRLLEP